MSLLPARRQTRVRGQSMVESTLALIAFFMLMFVVVDCGQVLVAHQSLLERVRSSIRWAVVRPWDGSGDSVANLILYGQPEEPAKPTEGYLGLTRGSVRATYRPATPERPDDEAITVAIVDFRYHFFSPWITKTLVSPRPILVSAPMAYRAVALK